MNLEGQDVADGLKEWLKTEIKGDLAKAMI